MAEGFPPPDDDPTAQQRNPEYVEAVPFDPTTGNEGVFVVDPVHDPNSTVEGDPYDYEAHKARGAATEATTNPGAGRTGHEAGAGDGGRGEQTDPDTEARARFAEGYAAYAQGAATAAAGDAARARQETAEAKERERLANEARATADAARVAAEQAAATAAAQRAAAEKDAASAETLRAQAEAARLAAQRDAAAARAAAKAIQDQEAARRRQQQMDALHDQAIAEDQARAAAAKMAEKATTTDELQAASHIAGMLENAIRFNGVTVRALRGQMGETPNESPATFEERQAEDAAQLLAMRTIQELTRQGLLTSHYDRIDERIRNAHADADLVAIFNNGWPGHMEPTQSPSTTMEYNQLVTEVRERRPDQEFLDAFHVRLAGGRRLSHDTDGNLRTRIDTRRAASSGPGRTREEKIMQPLRERQERIRTGRMTMADIAQEVDDAMVPELRRTIPGTKMAFRRISNRLPDFANTLATNRIGDLVEQYFSVNGPHGSAAENMHDLMDQIEGRAPGGVGYRNDLPGNTPQERLANLFLNELRHLNVTNQASINAEAMNGTPIDYRPEPEESAGKRRALGHEYLTANVTSARRKHAEDVLVRAFREVEIRDHEANTGVPATTRAANSAASRGFHGAASALRRVGRRR